MPGGESIAAGGGMDASGSPGRLAGAAAVPLLVLRGVGGVSGPMRRPLALAGCLPQVSVPVLAGRLLRVPVLAPVGRLPWVFVPGPAPVLGDPGRIGGSMC